MSRRPPNPSADRAAQNQHTLKTLVKLESNKSCADCKRNKHPRWASWNLGIFVCIRCSGIHRGMGTHISRVKSVDLDAWTDEQLQSMLRWGNARANKYWEAKLAPGHIPAENKIENFIRTKYDSRRWVMEGGIPDPASLDADGDDEVPLNVVQEKAKLDRSSSTRATSAPVSAAAPKPAPMLDLFGDTPVPAAASRTATPSSTSVTAPSKPSISQNHQQAPVPVKSTRPGESLLGFDFFGTPNTDPPSRPASAAASSNPTTNSRPDLKQSILSLYASAARSPGPTQPARTGPTNPPSFFDTPSTADQSSKGLDDAFGSLNFANASSPAVVTGPKGPSASVLVSPISPPASNASNGLSQKPPSVGGSFFDMKPTVSMPTLENKTATRLSTRPVPVDNASDFSQSFGGFTSTKASAKLGTSKPSNDLDDMFGFSAPAPSMAASSQKPADSTAASDRSPFNLSSPKPQPSPGGQAAPAALPHNFSAGNTTNLDNSDPWGSSDAWASAHAPAPAQPTTRLGPAASPAADEWSTATDRKPYNPPQPTSAPQITADEDFGGWESSAAAPSSTASTSVAPAKSSAGFTGGEDLFSNVWE